MDKEALEVFLLEARTKAYVAGINKSEPLLPGSVQYEHKQGDYAYRDVYYIGNGVFPGLETVFLAGRPVWSMSYFGDFRNMTEEQTDTMLRVALADLWQTARTYRRVTKQYDSFRYVCEGTGTIDELNGTEELYVGTDRVFFFYYAGGFIG